jgi:hypothetical protein
MLVFIQSFSEETVRLGALGVFGLRIILFSTCSLWGEVRELFDHLGEVVVELLELVEDVRVNRGRVSMCGELMDQASHFGKIVNGISDTFVNSVLGCGEAVVEGGGIDSLAAVREVVDDS